MNTQECCSNPAQHVHLHRSWRSVAFALAVGIGLTALVLWSTVQLSLFGPSLSIGSSNVVLPVFLLIGLVLISRPLLLMWDCKHEITCHHVRSTQGRCSLKRQFVEIPFEEILGVRASQTFLERLFGVGAVLIWTASAEHPDLIMKGIRDPEHYARVIGAKLDRAILAARARRAHAVSE